MSNVITSQYMLLPVPVVSQDPGPAYATDINTCLTTIDSHDHSSGKGIPVTPNGLNINMDLPFSSNNATQLRSVRFTTQASPLATISDLDCIYVSGVDLYYNDGNSNQIRITQSGSVAGSAGSIGGLVPPANVTYVPGSQTFTFQSTTATAANLDAGSVTLRSVVANAFGTTVNPANATTANYTLTLPAATDTISTVNNTNSLLNKNRLYNSDFFLWSRGTTGTASNGAATSSNAYITDRWYIRNTLGTGGVITCSQTAGTLPGSLFGASVQITSAPTSAQQAGCAFLQVLENKDSLPFLNQNASFAANIKSLGNVNQVGVQFFQSPAETKLSLAIGSEQLVTVSTTGFILGSISNQSIGSAQGTGGVIGVRIRVTGVASGNQYDVNNGFIVEQASLNIGPSPMKYQRMFQSTGTEILACQRFHYRPLYDTTVDADTTALISTGQSIAATQARIGIPFPTTMRKIPLFSATDAVQLAVFDGGGTARGVTSTSAANSSTTFGSFFANTGGGLTAGDATMLVRLNTLTAVIDFDAEI